MVFHFWCLFCSSIISGPSLSMFHWCLLSFFILLQFIDATPSLLGLHWCLSLLFCYFAIPMLMVLPFFVLVCNFVDTFFLSPYVVPSYAFLPFQWSSTTTLSTSFYVHLFFCLASYYSFSIMYCCYYVIFIFSFMFCNLWGSYYIFSNNYIICYFQVLCCKFC